MRYPKKIVKLPPDMTVGCSVGIVGEGDDIQKIEEIVIDATGDVTDIVLSGLWREPLCKIYLLRGRTHRSAIEDPTSWIDVAIGECDACGKKFPDSCVYHSDGPPTVDKTMICDACYKKAQGIQKPVGSKQQRRDV